MSILCALDEALSVATLFPLSNKHFSVFRSYSRESLFKLQYIHSIAGVMLSINFPRVCIRIQYIEDINDFGKESE